MRYLLGIAIFMVVSAYIYIICMKFAKEANKKILKEVKKKGYTKYSHYIKDMQKEEIRMIKKTRKKKRWKKYQKKHGL